MKKLDIVIFDQNRIFSYATYSAAKLISWSLACGYIETKAAIYKRSSQKY